MCFYQMTVTWRYWMFIIQSKDYFSQRKQLSKWKSTYIYLFENIWVDRNIEASMGTGHL